MCGVNQRSADSRRFGPVAQVRNVDKVVGIVNIGTQGNP